MKRIALVLCAAMALGLGAAAGAQGSEPRRLPPETSWGRRRSVDETTLALSDAAAPAKAANNAAGSTTLAYFLRMVFVLALVLAAIYGVYRLMKRASRPKAAGRQRRQGARDDLARTGQGPAYRRARLQGLSDRRDRHFDLARRRSERQRFHRRARPRGGTRAQGLEAGHGFRRDARGGSSGGRRRTGAKQARGDGDFLAGQRERLRKF